MTAIIWGSSAWRASLGNYRGSGATCYLAVTVGLWQFHVGGSSTQENRLWLGTVLGYKRFNRIDSCKR